MNATEAQKRLKALFSDIFGEDIVIKEWSSSKNAKDWLQRSGNDIIYTPRPDIAIGPFNKVEGKNTGGINNTFEQYHDFFKQLGLTNDCSTINKNPRCLIAIEVENSGSSKHMIGNIINASLLGKVGIIVTLRDEYYKKAERVFKYLEGAFKREKIGYNPSNVVIKGYDELCSILEEAKPS